MLESTYKGYLRLLSSVGWGYKNRLHAAPDSSTMLPNLSGFEALDEHATRLGNRYRGIGVSVGILGALIVFCALAPLGFALDEAQARLIGACEVGLMLLTIILIAFGRKSAIRQTWIAARRQAEAMRYQGLAAHIEKNDDQAAGQCLAELLEGEAGQIKYNQSKALQYELLESASRLVTWGAFFVALFGAVLHLFMHAHWLIFLTAFLPALVGVIHAINGFLQIGELADEHHVMANRLEEILVRLHSPKGSADELLNLARLAYQLLTTRDAKWADSATKLDLKPA